MNQNEVTSYSLSNQISGLDTLANTSRLLAEIDESSVNRYSQVPPPSRITDMESSSSSMFGKRKRDNIQLSSDQISSSLQKTDSISISKDSDKAGKGLRYFSVKVCEKLSKIQTATYNDLASSLIKDFTDEHSHLHLQEYDEKNIRRRIYDALNVFMALDIITKTKKQISWKGIASAPIKELEKVRQQIQSIKDRIQQKQLLLEEMALQLLAYRSILDRNNTSQIIDEKERLHIPFIVVKSKSTSDIQCQMNNHRTEVFCNFSDAFEIHDDNIILKQICLQEAAKGDIKELIPQQLQPFLPSMFPNAIQQPLDPEFERELLNSMASSNQSSIPDTQKQNISHDLQNINLTNNNNETDLIMRLSQN